jgi:hypothetical protein
MLPHPILTVFIFLTAIFIRINRDVGGQGRYLCRITFVYPHKVVMSVSWGCRYTFSCHDVLLFRLARKIILKSLPTMSQTRSQE